MKMEYLYVWTGENISMVNGRPRTAVWDPAQSAVKVFFDPGRPSEVVVIGEHSEPPVGFKVLASVVTPNLVAMPLPIQVVNYQNPQGVQALVPCVYHVYWRQYSDRTR